jgi:hypothetical protein
LSLWTYDNNANKFYFKKGKSIIILIPKVTCSEGKSRNTAAKSSSSDDDDGITVGC